MNHNINLKIISFFIALILFFFVHGQSNRTEIRMTVPIEFKNLPKNKYILQPIARQAEVTLRGPSHQVSAGASSSPVFTIKIPDNPENRYEINLTSENIQLPNLVEAHAISPAKIDLVLDDVVERSFPVAVPRIGTLNDGLRLIAINSDPAQVQILGPSTEVSKLRSIKTEPLDLRDITSSGSYKLKIEDVSSLITSSVQSVNVTVDVALVTTDRKFENQPIEIHSTGNLLYKLAQTKALLEVSGPKQKINGLSSKDFSVFIKIPENLKTPKTLPLEVVLPEDISLISLTPGDVLVSPQK